MKLKIKKFFKWIVSLFRRHRSLSVHYNKYNKEGEIIDVLVRKFEVKKFYKKTPKYMKFKTLSNKKVEIKTNNPMDYIIEDL
jgi:hypothetical protein